MRDKQSGAEETDHFSGLIIPAGDEVEHLSLITADMERDLAEYEDTLTRITAERERVSIERNMATQIQEAVLPYIFPAFPDRVGWTECVIKNVNYGWSQGQSNFSTQMAFLRRQISRGICLAQSECLLR